MTSIGESPDRSKASNGEAAESNCVAERRGGEQLEADLRSQTKVNTIRPTVAANLLADGEACWASGGHDKPRHSYKEKSWATEGSWCENAGKVPCGSNETHGKQEPEKESMGVRAAIVVKKLGNANGAKSCREVETSNQGSNERTAASVPQVDKQVAEVKAERKIWSEKMLEALEKGVKGNKWYTLMDKVYSEQTLELAWEKVKNNAGACGVDQISIGWFGKDSQKRLLVVKEQLKKRTYQPKPVKRVWIPKGAKGQMRPLGIPTVVDRVVQTAVRMVVEPIFEHSFHEHSYGFRPGRCCHDALRRVQGQLKAGLHYVVDVDIKSYFDEIDHDKLMEKVGEKISDGRVLELIESWLKVGVMEEHELKANESGTPQGGAISPLLANLYLNELDWELAEQGWEHTRYADDMVILCTSEQQAQQALLKVKQWMDSMGLQLHPTKTKIVDMNERAAHFDFLGYRFQRSKKKGKLVRLVRPKSEQKLKESLKRKTKPTNGESMQATIAGINPVLKGWFGYFRQANRYQLIGIDAWLRCRLRSIQRKRLKMNPRHRGRNDYERWPNSYFTNLGLFCLEQAKVEAIQSLRRANH